MTDAVFETDETYRLLNHGLFTPRDKPKPIRGAVTITRYSHIGRV